jgi:hypothetical protein
MYVNNIIYDNNLKNNIYYYNQCRIQDLFLGGGYIFKFKNNTVEPQLSGIMVGKGNTDKWNG